MKIKQVPLNATESDHEQILRVMEATLDEAMLDPGIRAAAVSIVAGVRDNALADMAQIIFDWVQTNYIYIPDPVGMEYLTSPVKALRDIEATGQAHGDCDCLCLLLAALLRAVGIDTRFAAVQMDGWKSPDAPFDHVIVLAGLPGGVLELDPCAKNRPQGQFPLKIYINAQGGAEEATMVETLKGCFEMMATPFCALAEFAECGSVESMSPRTRRKILAVNSLLCIGLQPLNCFLRFGDDGGDYSYDDSGGYDSGSFDSGAFDSGAFDSSSFDQSGDPGFDAGSFETGFDQAAYDQAQAEADQAASDAENADQLAIEAADAAAAADATDQEAIAAEEAAQAAADAQTKAATAQSKANSIKSGGGSGGGGSGAGKSSQSQPKQQSQAITPLAPGSAAAPAGLSPALIIGGVAVVGLALYFGTERRI